LFYPPGTGTGDHQDRTELRALAAAANQRVDFLERDLAAVKSALDKERATGNVK
jgi:hypothetical protein